MTVTYPRFGETPLHAELELIAKTLHPAAKGVLRHAKCGGKPPAMRDPRVPLALVILKDERTAVVGSACQAALEAALKRVIIWRRCRDSGDFRMLFDRRKHGAPSLLQQNVTRDPVSVTPNIVDDRLLELLHQTIERFIGTLFRWPRSSPLEKPHERTSKPFVFPSRLLGIRVEPREKTSEPGCSDRHTNATRFYQHDPTYEVTRSVETCRCDRAIRQSRDC